MWLKVKLNAYTGYVVPIAVYASQTQLPSRSNLCEFEKPNTNNDVEEALETTRQTERGEYRITKVKINKTNDNFFRRTKLFINYVSRVENGYWKTLNKITLQRIYRKFFSNPYVKENKCTCWDLQMWKLQHTKWDKTDLNWNWVSLTLNLALRLLLQLTLVWITWCTSCEDTKDNELCI